MKMSRPVAREKKKLLSSVRTWSVWRQTVEEKGRNTVESEDAQGEEKIHYWLIIPPHRANKRQTLKKEAENFSSRCLIFRFHSGRVGEICGLVASE